MGRTFCFQSTYTPRRAGSADTHPSHRRRPEGDGGSRGEEGAQQVAVYVGVKHSTATSSSCLVLSRRAGDMAAHCLCVRLEVWITCMVCLKLRQTARPVFVSKTAALWGSPRARASHSRTHGRSKYKKEKKKSPTNSIDINKYIYKYIYIYKTNILKCF